MSDSHGASEEAALTSLRDLDIDEGSVYAEGEAEFGLERDAGSTRLAVIAPKHSTVLGHFEGVPSDIGDRTLLLGPLSRANASALRSALPKLRPAPIGLATSAGFGDRLGLATPGHVRALREAKGNISPIFAQQSIREMERTGRSPQDVMDDATWGAMAEGWSGELGADADHLKTFEHVEACLQAGYTFFTFDPGDHVDDSAERLSPGELNELVGGLPWKDLEDSLPDLRARYLSGGFELESGTLRFDEESLYRAAAKYGRAVSHAASMYRHLQSRGHDREFEVEISVDETDSPTTHLQHLYIATELERLGVRWVSLAPRYVGTFEKGVDYIGDLEAFELDFAGHAAIARALGPYKLSLHSGSDKFSIYETASRLTDGVVHLKTAGTSYLEALKTLARADPALFREIYTLARERFERDRASYHVSASLDAAPAPQDTGEAELPALVEQFDAREILHVTFGSVLGDSAGRHRLGQRLYDSLGKNEEAYAESLREHFVRHLMPFVPYSRKAG